MCSVHKVVQYTRVLGVAGGVLGKMLVALDECTGCVYLDKSPTQAIEL